MQPKEHLALIMEQLQKTLLLRAKHCYTRKIVTPAKRCDFCKKTMFLMALRCKDCRLKCHRKCAQQAAKLCILAENHKLASGKIENQTAQRNLDIQTSHDASGKSVVSSQAPKRKDSTDSFHEVDRRRACSANRFATEQRLSVSSYTSNRKGGRISRSTLSSQSSNTSSVSGYHSLESDSSFTSDCETPTELQVFDVGAEGCGFLPTGGSSPRPHKQVQKQHHWVRDKSMTVCAPTDCHNQKTGEETRSSSNDVIDGRSLVATWPLDPKFSHKSRTSDDPSTAIEERVADWMRDYENSSYRRRESFVRREGLSEWTIPHKDLKYGRCIEAGRTSATYRGRWHGEVLIHSRHNVAHLDEFLDEVSMLSMIRHENIALFVGACVEPNHLAVVTSIQKGPSLYQHVHIQQKRIPTSTKVHIARQIAQGMGYLHAKGIIFGHLNSKCIFLESKVKLSMTRIDTTDASCHRSGYACLPRGGLNYLAPEMLVASRVVPPELVIEACQTQQTDVYAFGTTLFEILAGHWPFANACPESVIYQVCKGHRDSFDQVKCSPSLKNLVLECWSQEPQDRPVFTDIVKELKKNVAIVNMKHSLSEPENLNRLGTSHPW